MLIYLLLIDTDVLIFNRLTCILLKHTGMGNEFESLGKTYSAAVVGVGETLFSYTYIAKVVAHELAHLLVYFI